MHNEIISYSISNTNIVTGQVNPGQTVNISCPLDNSGATPKALLIQSTDWLEVYIYSSGTQVSLFHVNGIYSAVCPNDITKISLENRHSTVPLTYYITPLDDLALGSLPVFNNNVHFSDFSSSNIESFRVPLDASGNKPNYLMFQAKNTIQYTFDLDPSATTHNHGASFIVCDGQTTIVCATGAEWVIAEKLDTIPSLGFVTPLDFA